MTDQHELIELRDRLETEFSDLLAVDLKALGASQVHIVLVSDTDLTTSGEFSGLHAPKIGLWLKSYIPRWTGPAPAVLVDDGTIERDCGDSWHEMRDRFVAVATHEMAHVVDTPGLFARDDTNTDAPAEQMPPFIVEALRNKEAFYSGHRSPRFGHGVGWLRACCHLVFRMQQRGWDVYLPSVIDTDFYAISSTSLYARALGDEPARLAHMPLTEVMASPPPRKFLRQWRRDVSRFPV